MNKDSMLTGIIGLLFGLVIAGSVAVLAVNNDDHDMMRMMRMRPMHHMSEDTSMDAMTEGLRGKNGDDFDEAFIGSMIAHHEGAVDMARLAKENALHDEIKTLANDIISAQESEIEMMKTWQAAWGYEETGDHNSH